MTRKEYLSIVASLGCVICQMPANVHHKRTGTGMGRKAHYTDTFPLCRTHHQGAEGIHHLGVKAWQRKYGMESDFVKQTQDRVAKLVKSKSKWLTGK